MHLATVEALATAIDARDQIGMGHVRRTQIYAVGLGTVMGLEESAINALRTGALLHDIGKLAVPDHILNKPGKLTQAELEKTKIHASVGASILDKVGFPYPVVPTVRHHHEFWDGNGYPEGLKGRRIPLTARILAIADAYDALREVRPFRPAKTKAEAVDFLRELAGSQYDPTLVDLFLKNLSDFEKEIIASGLDYQVRENEAASRQLITNDVQSPNYIEQIKRANREVFTLYSIAREFTASLDLNETLVLFADKVAEFVPFDSIVITLLQPGSEVARSAYAGGANNALLAMRKTIVGQGATGYVLKKHIPVVNVDPAFDLSFIPDDELGAYRVMAALPLFADDQMIGAVSIYSRKLDYFQDEHIRLLETISHIAADAINIALQHAEAETYALTDPMTGLPNSRSLRSQFDKEVMRASRGGKRFELVVMDLDGFKSVNDNFGHKLGDAMLKAVGGVINGQLREYDFLARYGGDEFIAIVPETDPEGVGSLLERITDAVDSFGLSVGNGMAARVGISLGSASYPDDGETFDTLIEAADRQMYIAKQNNRTRVRDIDNLELLVNGEQDGNGYIPISTPTEEPKVLTTSVS
jgi:diguanylate cyclase (GGDEF)-like protein/putative nucleotidyltransferase with HDIG domain